MARGPKKHLKRLNAPKKWMLDKLSGKFAPRPSAGPHKLRESMPLIILIRNRLKYALTYGETKKVTMSRAIQVRNNYSLKANIVYPSYCSYRTGILCQWPLITNASAGQMSLF